MSFRNTLILTLCLFACCLKAQDAEPAVSTDSDSMLSPTPVLADRFMPALPDGELLSYVYKQVSYPEIAMENSVEGTVVVALSVAASGEVLNTHVVRSVPLLDQAALDAVADLPVLLPAVEDGHAVARLLYIPLRFSLR